MGMPMAQYADIVIQAAFPWLPVDLTTAAPITYTASNAIYRKRAGQACRMLLATPSWSVKMLIKLSWNNHITNMVNKLTVNEQNSVVL